MFFGGFVKAQKSLFGSVRVQDRIFHMRIRDLARSEPPGDSEGAVAEIPYLFMFMSGLTDLLYVKRWMTPRLKTRYSSTSVWPKVHFMHLNKLQETPDGSDWSDSVLPVFSSISVLNGMPGGDVTSILGSFTIVHTHTLYCMNIQPVYFRKDNMSWNIARGLHVSLRFIFDSFAIG